MRPTLLAVALAAALALPGCKGGVSVTSGDPAGEASAIGPPAAPSPVQFVDVATQLGLDYQWSNHGKSPLNILEVVSAGAAWIDFDADGWPDILLVGQDRVSLYRNDRGQRFVDVTAGSGFEDLRGRWHGPAVADWTGDGLPDVFLYGYRVKQLFRNVGGGRFLPVELPGLSRTTWGSSAAFLDANGDGWLDLVSGNYVIFGPGSKEFIDIRGIKITLGPDAYEAEYPQFFLNQGGTAWRDFTEASGVRTSMGRCLGISVCDFDGDGDDDFYIANDEMPANLFENDGAGHFTDRAVVSGTAFSGEGKRQGGMGVAWADYDNNHRFDLLVTTFTHELKSLYQQDPTLPGLFTERSNQAGISQTTKRWVGFGVRFFDADNNGLMDLAMVNGHVEDLIAQIDSLNSYAQPSKFFWNNGDGTFTDATTSMGPGFQKLIVGRALATADFDRDGDVDLLISDREGPVMLLRNEGGNQQGNWINLRLRGKGGNTQALGARVTVRFGDQERIQEVRTDGSFLCASDPAVHFGLAQATQADEITIRWPDGQIDTRGPEPANQHLVIAQK